MRRWKNLVLEKQAGRSWEEKHMSYGKKEDTKKSEKTEKNEVRLWRMLGKDVMSSPTA